MRVLVLSDLHLELGNVLAVPDDIDYDVVVLAGDIHSPGHKAVHWAQRPSTFGGRPVVLVPGNHEFYGCELGSELALVREAAEGSNVHVLSRDSVVIEGVRFAGCTLWTDFQLPVRSDDGVSGDTNIARALDEANRRLNDFQRIEVKSVQREPLQRYPEPRRPRGAARRVLRAEDTLAMHWIDRDWLRRDAEARPSQPTVVVTHHAPASGSVAERYASDWLTPAFVSALPPNFFEGVGLWVHGHTHTAFDYKVGHCRVVSNPRGYRMRDSSFENAAFNAGFVVEVG